jgi:hypothetical protein
MQSKRVSSGAEPLECTHPGVRDSVRVVRIQHSALAGMRAGVYGPGGAMAQKRYDPLWEIVDEKIALQGQEPDIDVPCPHCHVLVHLGPGVSVGARYACGLCGGVAEVVKQGEAVALKAVVEA